MTVFPPSGTEPTSHARYSAALLARAVGASVGAVRRWTRRGFLRCDPAESAGGSYSFLEARVARSLARMANAGMSLDQIDGIVDRLQQSAPAGCRPLADWDLTPDGDTVVVRRGGRPRDAVGQLMLEFGPAVDSDRDPPGEDPQAAVLPLWDEPDPAELPFDPEELRDQAADLLEQGDCLLAEQMLRALLLSGEGEPVDHLALGECLYRLGDLSAARERFSVCLEQEPDCVAARLSLGSVYQELEEWELAAGAFEGVLSQSPGCPDALIPLAVVCEQLGQTDRALELRRQLLRFAPDGPWADEARAQIAAHEEPPMVENPADSPILQGS